MDQTPSPPPSTSSDVRTWCVLCHASALLGLFFHFLGHILGPLIVWLMKRGDSPEIDAYGKESVLVIIASVKAGQGEFYRYPFTIRLIH
jgi:uncharacterized Tic20 family protein